MLVNKWNYNNFSVKMIQYFDWLPQVEALEGVDSIENQLAIFNYLDVVHSLPADVPFQFETMGNPHKFDFYMFVSHTSGSANIKIDMVEYELAGPYNIIKIEPGQIVGLEKFSPDFDASIVLLSKRFMESMMVYINSSVPLHFGFRTKTPIEHFEFEDINPAEIVLSAIRRCLQDVNNPYRLQVVQHMMMAVFYSSERLRDIGDEEKPRTNADVLSKEFMGLVKENFRKERQLKFYADKMCITPRYLSRVVKECTGASAAEWIERSVVLEARALLKSTNMTVQQISDELNFPSQTFFGKYFKRRVGMSPKEYRRMG